MSGRILTLVVVPSLLFGSADVLAKTQKTIVVDCAKGERIQSALEEKADELIISINGLCEEDILIERENVRLVGRDPFVDGLRGASPLPLRGDATIRLEHARNVHIQNLLVTESGRNGLLVRDSDSIRIDNCRFVDNSWGGAVAVGISSVEVVDTFFADNGRSALGSIGGAEISAQRITVASGPTNAVYAQGAGVLEVFESSLSSQRGALAFGGGYIGLYDTRIQASTWGLYTYAATIEMVRGSADGRIYADAQGFLRLDEVIQSGSGGASLVLASSKLLVAGDSALADSVYLDGFSKFVLQERSVLAGDLFCVSGSDAFCEDPSDVTGQIGACAHCSRP